MMNPVARTYSIHKEHNTEQMLCLSSCCVNNNKKGFEYVKKLIRRVG
jgi:hypothetical protein